MAARPPAGLPASGGQETPAISFRASWAGYPAALWALAFAVLHVVWAAGWYVGLNREAARKAFERRWFVAYDLVAAALCILAVCVALALVQPWGARLPRPALLGLASCGTAVLALRGGAGVLQAAYLVATGRLVPVVVWMWEVWFCVGALLFGLCTWRPLGASRGVPRP